MRKKQWSRYVVTVVWQELMKTSMRGQCQKQGVKAGSLLVIEGLTEERSSRHKRECGASGCIEDSLVD